MDSQRGKGYDCDMEKKELIQKLRELEEQHRILVENITDVIWRLDVKTMRLIYISPSVKQLRGYTQKEVMQQSIEEYLTPNSLAYVKKLMAERLDPVTHELLDDSEKVFILEQPCKDGTSVWTEATIHFGHQKDGTVEIVGVSRNYNKQKQQQEELVEAYRKLETGKNFLDTIMDTVPWEVVCLDHNGRIVYVNKKFADFFSLDRSAEKIPFYLDILPTALRKKHGRILEKCLRGHTLSFSEENAVAQEYIYGVYKPWLNQDKQVEGAVVVVMDITSQKETERQLVEAQRIAKMGSYEWDMKKKRLSCSEGLISLFGLTPKEIGQASYHAFLNKILTEDREKVSKLLDRIIEKRMPAKLEFQIEKDGKVFILYATNSLTFDKEGNPQKLVGSVIDITERKKMEDLQQEAAERLRDFARTLPDIAFIATEEGQIVEKFGNRELRNKKDENDLKKLTYKTDAAELLDKIRYALEHDKLQFGEYTLDTAIGKRIFEIRIAPMRYIANGKRTVACNATDITDKSRAQRFLELSYEQRRQREILNDLVEGRSLPSQLVLDQAWRVKLNLARPFSCYLVVIKSWKGKPLENWLDYQEGYQFFIDSLTEILITEIKAVVWESREGIAILCPPVNDAKDIKAHELATAERIKELVYSYFPDASIIIGIGEFHADTFQNIALVYSQAYEAVRSGPTMSLTQDIFHYLDLGMFQILPLFSDREKVMAFIDRTIGKLLEYDRKKGSNLVLTMEKILQTDNLKHVADEMYVHHKTIAFRKKRIEKILNISLDTLDNKTTLNMALKLRQIFSVN